MLLLTTFLPTLAQIEFEHYSDDNGLINASISQVIKDSQGFIWIATKQGLDRYDGYSSKHFTNDPSSKNTIPENHVRCIAEGLDNKIYLGYFQKGFSVFDKKTEKFENFLLQYDSTSKSHETVFTIYADNFTGMVWLGTSKGLKRFNPFKREITRFYPFKDFSKQYVTSIVPDKQGNLWLYGPQYLPCLFNYKKHQYRYLKQKNFTSKTGQRLEAHILLDRNNNLWFGNEWEGLCRYNLQNGESEKYSLEYGFLKSNLVESIYEDSEGNIWIGTDGAGLFKYNIRKKAFEKFQYIANQPNNLTSNSITSIYESQPGVIWFGTLNNGINIWKRDKQKFSKIGLKTDADSRLNNASVLGIAPAPDRKIWIGTDGGGLNLYDPVTQTCQYYTTQNSPICHNSIKPIITTQDGTIWYGTNEYGLCNVNFSTGVAQTFQKEIVGVNLKSGFVNSGWTLCKTYDEKLWIGLLQGGIKVYDLVNKKFINVFEFSPQLQKLTSTRINCIIEDSKKRIWIAADGNGIICYDPISKHRTVFTQVDGDEFSLKSKSAKTIYEDKSGNIWIGMNKGGLSRLIDFGNKKFITYTVNDGLPNNNIKSIIEDGNGKIWIGTEKGISCFYLKENKFKNFDSEDGAQGVNFHSNSIYKDSLGVIYIGGSSGFNFFHPDSLRFNNSAPPLAITDIKIFGESLSPNKKLKDKIYITESVTTLKELELSYSDNLISIEFAALDFQAPLKNKYAYKLEGFNNNWIHVGSEHRLVSYTNIEPGTYTFRVIASNNDGVWNNEGISLKIIVTPPFYYLWWVRLIAILALAGIIAGVYFWRTRTIRRRNILLKEEVENQTQQLRKINEELQKTSEAVANQANDLRQMNEELQQTAEELAKQNQTSLALYKELTEGLEAARVIQNAILPGKELLERSFGDLDILYKPKDLVSGDFYWFTKMDNKPVLAVVDCTGHGVAGAFMTFIGYEILNQISRRDIPANPGLVISLLNEEILSSLNHYRSEFVNAGMDVSLCILDKEAETLYFAGANNPLYIVRGEEVLIFKGDRQGVGGKQKSENYIFKTYTIKLEKGDQVYIFSDGYADQIGGPDGNEKYMYNRLRDSLLELKHTSVKKRISILGNKFNDWKGKQDQLDDVLLICFDNK